MSSYVCLMHVNTSKTHIIIHRADSSAYYFRSFAPYRVQHCLSHGRKSHLASCGINGNGWVVCNDVFGHQWTAVRASVVSENTREREIDVRTAQTHLRGNTLSLNRSQVGSQSYVRDSADGSRSDTGHTFRIPQKDSTSPPPHWSNIPKTSPCLEK